MTKEECINNEASKNAERNRYEKFGFRNWEEVLSYLKEGKMVFHGNDSYSYDKEEGKVKYRHISLFNNRYLVDYQTDKEFMDRHHDADELFPEYCRNEYGFIGGWWKDSYLDDL